MISHKHAGARERGAFFYALLDKRLMAALSLKYTYTSARETLAFRAT